MTDEQIIKALERCFIVGSCSGCAGCPLKPKRQEDANCIDKLVTNTIDLIKRQQAEIEDKQKHLELWVKKFYAKKSNVERLEMEKAQLESDISNALCNLDTIEALYENARAEAIKEFVDKLKEKAVDVGICDAQGNSFGGATVVFVGDIDNLVKEMGCGE